MSPRKRVNKITKANTNLALIARHLFVFKLKAAIEYSCTFSLTCKRMTKMYIIRFDLHNML